MKSRYESQEDYVTHLLGMVAVSQHLIAALEHSAQDHPTLMDECGEAIEREKQWIGFYTNELRRAYALSD